jgi:hypothetical protein
MLDKIWPNGKYFGALNPLFHGRNQACKKYWELGSYSGKSGRDGVKKKVEEKDLAGRVIILRPLKRNP